MWGVSACRFTDCHLICQSVNLPVRRSADRNGGNMLANLVTVTKSASQEICWQKWGVGNLPADLVTVTKSASQEICWQMWGNLPADLVTVTKSASQEIYWQKWGLGNLPADLVTVTKSASQEICWQMWGESASRFSDCDQICQSVNLPVRRSTGRNKGWNLPADLVTVTKSAS